MFEARITPLANGKMVRIHLSNGDSFFALSISEAIACVERLFASGCISTEDMWMLSKEIWESRLPGTSEMERVGSSSSLASLRTWNPHTSAPEGLGSELLP